MKKLFCSVIAIVLFVPFLSMAYDANQHFAYVQALYNRHDKKLYEYLLNDLDQYTRLYPKADDIDEAHYLIAKVYEEKGDEYAALAAHIKTMFLFPSSPRRANSAEAIRQLIAKEKAFRAVGDKINNKISSDPTEAQEAYRYFNYLQFCRRLKLSKLSEWLIAESFRFIEQFPEYDHIDTVLQITGDLYREKGEHKKAMAAYLKLEYFTPNSEFIPDVRFQRARLLYKKSGKPDEAFALFTQVAQEHPESPYAAKALFLTGEIKEKKHKDYNTAIIQYRLSVDTYPQSENAVEALWRVAKINVNRLKDFAAGIGTFKEIAEKYPNNLRAIKALEEASGVYKSKLKDDEKAAQTLAQLVEKYPNDERSPDLLYKAGDIMKDGQHNEQKAIEYYEQVIKKYPDHKRADKARKEIEKIKEKLKKEQRR